jgi:LmbE family N-acetylglucosaminyl deacetylase
MPYDGTLTSPPVSERLIRGEPAPEPAQDGALATLAAESAAIVARGRRVLSPRHYWGGLARRFPPTGIEPGRLDASLEAIVREGTEVPGDPDAVTPLPGLTVLHGHAFYAGHWLGRVPAEVDAAWEAVSRGARGPAAAALLDAGLAVAGSPRVDACDRSVVIVPHRDDAALALGGTLAARLHLERPIVVAIFTVSSWLGEGLRPRPPQHVTELRRREEETSTRALGAQPLGLEFWDVDVRTMQRVACDDDYAMPEEFRWELDPGLRPIEELEAMRTALRAVVARLSPRRVYLPLGIGGQSDHHLTALLAEQMLPFHQAQAAEVVFYEDHPYAAKAGPDAVAAAATARGLRAELVDVSASFERKIQAVAAHRSQFARGAIEPALRGYAEAIGGGAPAERLWWPTA